MQDPELTSLLEQPSLAALRAQPPGSAVLRTWNPDWIAYSAKHGRLAVLDPHDGLRVFSLKPGRLDAVLDLGSRIPRWSGDGAVTLAAPEARIKMEKSAKATFDRKLPTVNRFLADLGFVEVTRRELGKLDGEPDSYHDVLFPGSGMKLVFDGENKLRLVYKTRTIAENDGLWGNRLNKVILLPALNTLVWQWSRSHGATDCHRLAGTEILFPAKDAGVR